jgi:hypothetical protein
VLVWPALSVTVNVAVNLPGAAYVCVGFSALEDGLPSPKFHDHPVIVAGLAAVDASVNATVNEPGF